MLPESVRVVFRFKAELDLDKYRALDASGLLHLARYVTAKPSTPSIKIEVA
jgi:hypothetical protein